MLVAAVAVAVESAALRSNCSFAAPKLATSDSRPTAAESPSGSHISQRLFVGRLYTPLSELQMNTYQHQMMLRISRVCTWTLFRVLAFLSWSRASARMYVCMYACVCGCVCACTYVYTYMYVCMYTYYHGGPWGHGILHLSVCM